MRSRRSLTNITGFVLALIAPLLATVASSEPAAAASIGCSSTKESRQPVLLVHGYNSGPQTWNATTQAYLAKAGSSTCIALFDYSNYSSLWVTDSHIGPALAKTIQSLAAASKAGGGSGKVIVVAHSMGGLATRCAAASSCNGGIQNIGADIAELISFGTPNQGSWLVGPGLHDIGRTVGSLLSAACTVSFNHANDICVQIRALGTSDATRAFKPESTQLKALPQLPSTVPVYALAAQIEMYSSFFGLKNTDIGDAGDLIVLEDSATAAARKINGIGGQQVINCGQVDITDFLRSAHSCWHSTETNDTRFLEAAAHQIALVENANGSTPGGQMNLQQIAAGNYSSLLGTWTEEALVRNPQDGSGEQWKSGGSDTLSVSGSRIVNATQGDTLQGSTLTSGFGGSQTSNSVSFQNNGKYLEASLANQNVAINWLLRFYPAGAVELNAQLTPNNGVSLDSSKNTIYIWTSNNGYAEVFTQGGAAKTGTTKTAPPKTSGTAACLTPAEFTSVLATPGITVKQVIYCGGGWAATSNSDCANSAGVCNAVDGVFHAVGSRWTVSNRHAICDGADSPIPSKYQWFCQGD